MARGGKAAGNSYGDTYNNPFALRSDTSARAADYQRRHQRRNMPRWLQVVLLVAVIGGGGYGVYYVLNPPATRSAQAVALDFLRQLDTDNHAKMLMDIEPSQRATAASDWQRQGLLCPAAPQTNPSGCQGPLATFNFPQTWILNLNTLSSHGSSASVSANLCGPTFSCGALPAVPCVEQNGSWYVDWDAFLLARGINP